MHCASTRLAHFPGKNYESPAEMFWWESYHGRDPGADAKARNPTLADYLVTADARGIEFRKNLYGFWQWRYRRGTWQWPCPDLHTAVVRAVGTLHPIRPVRVHPVTPWLAIQLTAQGEPVEWFGRVSYWSRTEQTPWTFDANNSPVMRAIFEANFIRGVV